MSQHPSQIDYQNRWVKWQHDFAGRPATVYTDEFDGYDRGQPTWVEDTTGTECTIRLEYPRARAQTGMADDPRDMTGTGFNTDNDAVIVFDPDEVTVHDGIPETQRASIIHDHQTDIRFRVVRVRDENGPLHLADCEDLRNTGDDVS